MSTFENNKQAFLNPRVGDYWNEHMIPYFLIVEKIGSLFVVVVRKINNNNEAYLDLDLPLVYSKFDIEDEVKYSSAKGKPLDEKKTTFVADVRRSEQIDKVVTIYHQKDKDKIFKDRLRELIKRKKNQVRAIKYNTNCFFRIREKLYNYHYQEVIFYDFVFDSYLNEKPYFVPKIKAQGTIKGVQVSKFLNGVWVTQPHYLDKQEFNFFIKESGWVILPEELKEKTP